MIGLESVKKKKERECTSEKRIVSGLCFMAGRNGHCPLLAIAVSATGRSFQSDQGLCVASDGNAEFAVSSDPALWHRILAAGDFLYGGNGCRDWRMSALWRSSAFVRVSGNDGLCPLLSGGSPLSAFEF